MKYFILFYLVPQFCPVREILLSLRTCHVCSVCIADLYEWYVSTSSRKRIQNRIPDVTVPVLSVRCNKTTSNKLHETVTFREACKLLIAKKYIRTAGEYRLLTTVIFFCSILLRCTWHYNCECGRNRQREREREREGGGRGGGERGRERERENCDVLTASACAQSGVECSKTVRSVTCLGRPNTKLSDQKSNW